MLVSIIIPMRNEEAFVGKCLDSVLAQIEGRHDVEVLCVNGASTDRTLDIVREYADRDSRVTVVDNPDRIVPCGMNRAITRSKGDILIRLDCHCEYAPDYIDKCIEVLERTSADNVGGYVLTTSANDTPIGRAVAAATASRFGVGGSVFRTGGGEQEVDTVPFGCFKRSTFERFGLYDERLVRNQDIELNSRIRKGGGRIVISPDITLTYFTRSTFTGLRQQAFNNGLWNPYTMWIAGGGLRVRHFVPLVFVLSLLVLGCGGLWWPPIWYALALELTVYLIGAFAFGSQAARKNSTSVFLVVFGFMQLHVAYGIGLLWGVITAPVKFKLRSPCGAGEVLADRRD